MLNAFRRWFPQEKTAKRNEFIQSKKSYMENDFREVVVLRPLFCYQDEEWYFLDFFIVPINEKYCSDIVDVVPITGYTTV